MSDRQNAQRIRRVFNWKGFLILIVGVLVVGGGLFGLHYSMVRLSASKMLAQGEKADSEGKLDLAVRGYSHYVGLRPKDMDVKTKLGKALAKQATTPIQRRSAAKVLCDAAGIDPARSETLREGARIYAEIGLFDEARDHFQILLARNPNDGEAEYYLAVCEAGRSEFAKADQLLIKAIKDAPKLIKAYTARAVLLRRNLNGPSLADVVMDEMVAANPDKAEAYLERGKYRLLWSLPNASKDILEASRLKSDLPELALLKAQQSIRENKFAEGEKILREASKAHPEDLSYVRALSKLLTQIGRPADAAAILQGAMERFPAEKDLAWSLADNLIQAGKTKEVPALIKMMREEKVPEPPLNYLEGALALRESKWDEALLIFDRAAPQLERLPEIGARAYLALGICQERLNASEQALAAFRKAVALAPSWPAARGKLASALASSGRYEEASKEFRGLSSDSTDIASQVTLANLKISATLQVAEAKRNWAEAERLVAEVEKAAPGSLDAILVRAEILSSRGRNDEATKRLEDAKAHFPAKVGPSIALAMISMRQGKIDDAKAYLDKAPVDPAGGLAIRLAKIDFWAKRGGVGAGQALDQLQDKIETFAFNEQLVLWEALGRANLSLARFDATEKCYKTLVDRQPDTLRYRSLQLELAARRESEAGLTAAIAEIRRLEGERGVSWRLAQARLLIVKAQKGERQGLSDARRLLGEVDAIRSGLSDLPQLYAAMDELESRGDQAIVQLQAAIKQGSRDSSVIRRLIQLLADQGRYQEADRTVRTLEAQGNLDTETKRLAAELAMRIPNRARAKELVRSAVPVSSRDPKLILWRGRMLVLSDPSPLGLAEAEASLKLAVEIAPTQAEYWLALVDFLVSTRRRDEALLVMPKAVAAIEEPQRLQFEAEGNQLLRRFELAKKAYESLLTRRPDDQIVIRAAAGFFQGIEQFRTSEKLWRKILAMGDKLPPAELHSARIALASLLGKTGRPRDLIEALSLIEQNLKAQPNSLRDQRAKVDILARQPEHRKEALGLIEAINQKGDSLTLNERVQFANLLLADGQWSEARKVMLEVLGSAGSDSLMIATYIQMLLAQKTPAELAEADKWIATLAEREPASLVPIEFKARRLVAENKKKEAVELLEGYVKSNPKTIDLFALLLERLDLQEAAEKMLRLSASNVEQPRATLALARYFARRKRFKEALDLCESVGKKVPPEEYCSNLLMSIDNAKADQALNQRVETLFQAVIDSDPATRSTSIPVMMAVTKSRLNKFDEAEAIYRASIKEKTNDIASLNNLAWFLALRARGQEALPMIERVIAEFGPSPKFLDSRGVVELAVGRIPEAIEDFQDAIAGRPDDIAAVYFHLALAQHMAKNDAEAKAALDLGHKIGLDAEFLEPLERPTYLDLVKTLGSVK